MKRITLLIASISCLTLCATSAHAAATTKYWDINSTTAGSGGPTPAGTWSSSVATWNSDPAGGAGTFSAWTFTNDIAVFSAGTDASGEFTVNLTAALTAGMITNEEGIVNLTGSALTVSNINIKAGAMLSYVSANGIAAPTGSRLNLSGGTGTLRNNSATVGSTFLPTAMATTLGTGGGSFSVDAATTAISIYGGVISGTGPFTKLGQGIFRLTAVATYSGATVINGGSIQISTTANVLPAATDLTINSGGKLDLVGATCTVGSLAGPGLVTSTSTLTVSGSPATSFDGVISGSGSLVRSGAGTLILTGVNTYSGTCTISAGTVNVAASGALCGPVCDLIVNGGTLSLTNASQSVEDFGGTGGTVILDAASTLNVSATFFSTARPTNYAGFITGAGNLTLVAGCLQLSGTNNYSGATTVSAGNLLISGKYTANGSATVNSGTLTQSGTNTGNGAIALNGGKLVGLSGGACSNSVVTVAGGTVHSIQVTNATRPWVCGGLTFNSGTLDFDFGHDFATSTAVPSTTLAPLQVNGNLDFTGGTPTVTIEAFALPAGAGSYPLITWTGTASGTFPTTVTGLAAQTAYTLTVVGNTLFLNVSANPEPLRWATGSGTWDIATTPNWKDNALSLANYLETTLPGDQVVFEDTLSGASPITVTLNATVSPADVTATNSKAYTISGGGAITGSTKLTKSGSGVLTLASANSFTGPTVINAGTLQLGDGTVNGSVTGPITNSASLVVSNASDLSYANVISGSGSLAKGSAGILTLSGANTFSGGQVVRDGILYLTSTANAMSGPIAVTNATLEVVSSGCIGATVVGAGDITLNNGATFQNDQNAVATFLTANRKIIIGPNGGRIAVPGGSPATDIQLYTGSSIVGSTPGLGTLTFDGPGELRVYGTTTHNTFGKLIINSGRFCVGQATTPGFEDTYGAVPGSPTADAITVRNGAEMRYNVNTNALVANRGITIGGGSINANGGTIRIVTGAQLTIPGIITGSEPLTLNTQADAGILALTGANTISGSVTLYNGEIRLGNAQALGTAANTVHIGASDAVFGPTLRNINGGALTLANNPQTWHNNFTFAGTNDLNFGAAAVTLSPFSGTTITLTINTNVLTVGGIIGGAGFGLTKAGTATLQLNALNTYDGDTTISAGTLQLGDSTANNGSVAGNIINNGTLLTWANPAALSYGGIISGTGPLTKQAAGTLTLGGASTYTGNTTVSTGAVQLAIANALPSGSRVLLSAGTTLDMNGFSDTIAALSGPGRVINNSGSLTVSGPGNDVTSAAIFQTYSCVYGSITNGSLVKDGTHTMALRETNTLAIPVILSGGTLSVGVISNQLSVASALTIPSGATFQLDAVNQTVASLAGAGNVNLGGGALIVTQTTDSAFSGNIQNSDLSGSSTAVGHGLRGYYYDNLDFTSLLAVRDDTSVNFTDLTSAAQLPAAIFANSTNQVSIRWLGQVLTTTNGTYTFTTTCDDGSRLWVNGTLVVDNWVLQGATAKSGAIALAANKRYDIMMEFFNNTGGSSAKLLWTPPGDTLSTNIPTDNLFLPSPGQLVKAGSGKLTLSGANTYSGGTVVSGGTLDAQSALGTGDVTVNSATLTLETTAAIAATADLLLNGASVAHLDYSGSDTIHGLSFDGGATYQAATTYGATGSGAAVTDNTHFTGTGTLTVTAVAATNLLTSSANPVFYGSSLTFTSRVTGSGATPTGTVTFYDGASAMGTAPLSAGVATLTVNKLSVPGSPHSITALYNGDVNYTHTTSGALSQAINPAPIVPNFTVANRIYNGTSNAAIASISFAGIVSGDAPFVNVTNGPAFFNNKHVGVAKPINLTGLVLGGSLAGNYVLSPTTTNANITQTNLTIAAVTNTKPYDGSTNAAAIPGNTVGSIQPGDTSNFTEAYADPEVGTGKTLIPAGSVTDGNIGANYNVTFVNNPTGIITPLCSATNVLQRISANLDGTFTLSFQGTPHAQYYVVAHTNVALPMNTWSLLAGSTNIVTNTSGLWTLKVTNTVPSRYYRSTATSVCP